ncbi:MAG: alginate export family protein [Candidatus Omnitrophica bacterium]|nr:alginate export family protein [Candidatus Omnitrophota bacterium]
MGKRLIGVLALALVVGLTFSAAYAEVQNVKVSGDITAAGVLRNHFNLARSTNANVAVKSVKQSFLMSQIRLRVDADLTDNVMATVRLINERIWNGQNDTNAGNTNNTNIDIDLAYVTLKEFLYSPLTLTIGRQEISFGNSLVIGKSGAAAGTTSIPSDLSERSAFDAIRATLNYDPLVVDLVYAQVSQTNTNSFQDSTSLTGINATYALNKKANLSGYYWLKKINAVTNGSKPDNVNTVGALVSITPIDNLATSLEAAYQFGKNTQTNNQKRHDAWALQAMANYTFAKVKTTPKIGASWTYLSGGTTGNATRNEGWDPMFYNRKLNNIVYAILPFSNMNAFNLSASAKPVEDVTISAVYGYYNVAHRLNAGTTSPSTSDANATSDYSNTYSGNEHLGDALDLTVTYDYTEDVQFALTGGMFKPGNGLKTDYATANQVIGSMKVTF